jgi:hypothetical protein
MTPQEVDKEIDAFCSKMSEYVESIRIVASMPVKGATGRISRGKGNYYAQVGSVEEWLESCRDMNVADEIAKALKPPRRRFRGMEELEMRGQTAPYSHKLTFFSIA